MTQPHIFRSVGYWLAYVTDVLGVLLAAVSPPSLALWLENVAPGDQDLPGTCLKLVPTAFTTIGHAETYCQLSKLCHVGDDRDATTPYLYLIINPFVRPRGNNCALASAMKVAWRFSCQDWRRGESQPWMLDLEYPISILNFSWGDCTVIAPIWSRASESWWSWDLPWSLGLMTVA